MQNDSYTIIEDSFEQIAVIGMACRFPGANDIEQFWENLVNGKESIVQFTDDELRAYGVPQEWLSNPQFVKVGTILDDVDKFDAAFFGISPREALVTDPQHRLFLETAWKALENAGYTPESHDGLIGVFAGSSPNDYQSMLYGFSDYSDVAGQMELMIGNEKDYLATRISYKLNLKGPSLTVQAGCSTSLVAVQLACQNLLNYQCSVALAGGASIKLLKSKGYFYQEGAIVSPDGHCRAFDAMAQGTVVGQGVGVVVLKRLSEAIQDGDHVYAVIKSSAINNDGSTKIGYTAPSIEGQAEVIAMAHTLADVQANSITYVEAHGTGTILGDPIEIAALTKAFRESSQKKGFCAIGSVKTNIGHADITAGVAGLIKTVLMLHNRKIPPSLHFNTPNTEIDFDNSPFYVASTLANWQKPSQYPRRAGVSSFGIGGTNAHAVLEEAPEFELSSPSRSYQLLILSAKTESALDASARNLFGHLEAHPDLSLADVAYTLQTGRKEFNYRRMMVCSDVSSALSTLKTTGSPLTATAYQEHRNPPVVFLFTGQGSQYVGMGSQLYTTESTFRKEIDRCSDILRLQLSMDLRDVLYPDKEDTESRTETFKQTAIAQPALFTVEYALAKLWMSWGIQPSGMIGHSIGEYVAACLAGVFSLEDALRLVASRGRLMQRLPMGEMLAVSLSESETRKHLPPDLSIAAINAPSQCVVSGEQEAIRAFEEGLKQNGVACCRLHTSHAFHSKMIDPIKEEFIGLVSNVQKNPPRIPFVSNVTGTWITPEEATDPYYWVNHMRRTVRFSDGIRELLTQPGQVFIEVGPGKTLSILIRQHIENSRGRYHLPTMRHSKEEVSDVEFILKALGRLWLAGVAVDWSGFYQEEIRYRVPLPTYPFEGQRFWPETAKGLRKSNEFQQFSIPVGAKCPVGTGFGSISSFHADEAEAGATGIEQPGNETERKIAEIWQNVLRINQIGIHDDYFELGGSSLMVPRIFAQIEQIFGKKIPVATILNAPTVEKLARIVADDTWQASWSSLVPIKEEGSRPPFFCAHGAGGNVLLYRALARHLPDDQPFYGLQSRGMDSERSFDRSIEEMASHYVEEILKVYPDGPFMFGGYCMGGTIAFEIAQQLTAQGKTVDLLVFLETYNWGNLEKKTLFETLHFYWQKIDFHLRNLFIAENRLSFLYEKAKVTNSRKKIYYEMAVSKFNQRMVSKNGNKNSLSQLWTINDEAALKYKPKRYSGRIITFLPLKQYSLFVKPEAGWQDLAAGGVEERVLPVYPAGMLVEPFVKNLATELSRCIERATATKN